MSWEARGATIAGSAGPAFGRDGTIYVATERKLAALELGRRARAENAEAEGRVHPRERGFRFAPIVIQHKEKDLVAVAAKDGRIFVLDGATLQRRWRRHRQPES